MTKELTLALAQVAVEGTLAENRTKIVRFVHEARARGCRVVVLPESALYSPAGTTVAEIEAAVDAVRQAARDNEVYVLLGLLDRDADDARLFNSLRVIDPRGEMIQRYHKLFDVQPNRLPGLFYIDGVPCSAIICADRWIRGVEDLPAIAGSVILFECSDNYAREWVPDLGWYWYVPRALRNGAYVVFANTAAPLHEVPSRPAVGHGHSAVIAPGGEMVIAAGGEPDRLLVATVDLDRAAGAEAQERRSHPAFKPFWDAGLRLLNGEKVEGPPFEGYTSPEIEVRIAVAQTACSRDVAHNTRRMVEAVRTAADNGADLVAFPELAVTGRRKEDVRRADWETLNAALGELQAAAREAGLCVLFGMPHLDGERRQNCAFVLGPDGSLLTRYAQLVVDREDLFTPGTYTGAMWFRLKGVPCAVTVGRREALWNEIAELAAVRGAQVHVHLDNDDDDTPEGALLRAQLWVNLASYHTLTATVNAAPAGGSTIWEDSRRQRGSGPYPYCAVPIARAEPGKQMLYATHTVSERNLHFERMAFQLNPQMRAWYEVGAQIIHTD